MLAPTRAIGHQIARLRAARVVGQLVAQLPCAGVERLAFEHARHEDAERLRDRKNDRGHTRTTTSLLSTPDLDLESGERRLGNREISAEKAKTLGSREANPRESDAKPGIPAGTAALSGATGS